MSYYKMYHIVLLYLSCRLVIISMFFLFLSCLQMLLVFFWAKTS